MIINRYKPLRRNGASPFSLPKKFAKDKNFINGLFEYTLNLKQHIQCCDSTIVEKVDSGDPKITQLNFVNFQPGSVIAIRYKLQIFISVRLISEI